ncbi:hypothetical protein LCGC14_0189890 [marine sediment metagenome]|uniref:Uncharacterized protein n=1 Tax=marine sediment metagenome TaxID=412755 RepID=A0A0F9ULU4_9ZZZZ|nr:hypothetical protein [Maribacter sp.]HDZ06701.1 hypothetical protein [Maribacter sp.]HEA79541.1 hypothetical protein [Maribacter sp.]
METNEINAGIKAAQINNALGFFILVFGCIVLFAMIYTETFIEHMTDMIAGLLLISIGGGMIWKARNTIKKLKAK